MVSKIKRKTTRKRKQRKTRKQKGGVTTRSQLKKEEYVANAEEPAAAGAGGPAAVERVFERKPLTENAIWWLLQALGTDVVMRSIISYYSRKRRYKIRHRRAGESVKDTLDDMKNEAGLVFCGEEGKAGHWVSVVKEGKEYVKRDPYYELVQQKGTHGFCQTFSIMLFLNKKLERGDNRETFNENTRLALEFILEAVTNSREVSDNIINELPAIINENRKDKDYKKIDEYIVGISLNGKSICLTDMTKGILIEFLKSMINQHVILTRLLMKNSGTFIRRNKISGNERWYIENGDC
jgi:hypothetical protein